MIFQIQSFPFLTPRQFLSHVIAFLDVNGKNKQTQVSKPEIKTQMLMAPLNKQTNKKLKETGSDVFPNQ